MSKIKVFESERLSNQVVMYMTVCVMTHFVAILSFVLAGIRTQGAIDGGTGAIKTDRCGRCTI